jgi:quercetin dioxygenase-like cupin family protein
MEDIEMTDKKVHRAIGRPLDRPLSAFDIQKTLAELRAEEEFSRDGHNAIILHKEGGLKVVVVAMRSGYCIKSHRAAAPITVQVIEGSMNFNTEDDSLLLRKGEVLVLHAGLAHDVKALEDSAFLLTLAGDASSH